MSLNTLEKDDLLRRIAWLNAEIDKIKRMLKGEQMGTARIADAAITNAKISDLTWDKAHGGTATLGGLNNVDGILEINDAANAQIGKWDKDGILINDGKLEIRNDSEVVSIDAKGIVSTANFTKTGSFGSGLNQQISNTEASPVDITSSSLSFTLARTQNILIEVKSTFWVVNPGTANDPFVMIDIDGSTVGSRIWFRDPPNAVTGNTHFLTALNAGSHTIKLKGAINKSSGTPSINIYDFLLSYIIFGT